MATDTQVQQLLTFLVGTFDAAPTAEIMAELEGGLDAGVTVAQFAEAIVATDYFTGVYATTEDFAADWASNLIGAYVSEEVLAEANEFIAYLIDNGASVADVITAGLTALSSIDEADETWGAAAAALNNKIDVANYFVDNASGTGYTTVAQMQAILSGVTNDDATVTTAEANIDEIVNDIENPGSTFTLTTGTDTVFGTAGDDVFTATSSTLTAGDVIADSSSTDSDTLNVSATKDLVTSDLTIVGIENVAIDVTSLASDDGAGETVNTATTSFDLDADGISASSVSVDTSNAFTTVNEVVVTNAATGMTLTTGENLATVSIASKADNATLSVVASADDADVTVTAGTGNVSTATVTTSGTGETTVTASDVDGTLTVTTAEEADVTTAAKTVVLSSADDADENGSTLSATAATTLTVSGNGGASVIDANGNLTALRTVTFSGDQAVTLQVSATDADEVTATGTGTLELAAAGTADLSDVANTVTISVSDATSALTDLLTVQSGATVAVDADAAGIDVSASEVTATDNHLNLVITDNDDDDTTDSDVAAFDVNDFATVTLTLEDNVTASAGNYDFGTADLTVEGDFDLDLTNNELIAQSVVVSGAGDTTLVLDGTAGDVEDVTTGAGDDSITLSAAGQDTYSITTGAGNDEIIIGATDVEVNIDAGTGSADKITFSAAFDSTGTGFEFSFTGVEALDLNDNDVDVTAAQVSGKSFALLGDSTTAADVLTVMGTANNDTIDLSGVVVAAGDAELSIDSGVGNDTITGSAGADTIDAGAGVDTINAGAGDDTIVLDAGDFEAGETVDAGEGDDTLDLTSNTDTELDLSLGSYSGFETIDLGLSGTAIASITALTITQSVQGDADDLNVIVDSNGTPVATLESLFLTSSSTNFESAAESTADDVDVAGEWNLSGGDTLTYFNEELGEVAVITITGATVTASVTAGDIELAIA